MKTKSIARKHHYLTQAYLAAFTRTGLKDGQFNVFDVNVGNSFTTSPVNVAAEKDFNRVDIEGQPPDAVEKALSPLEGKAVAAIRKVIESEIFPNDNDLNLILNFLGLIAVRNPKLRKSFNYSREQVINRILDIIVSDREIWNSKSMEISESESDICNKVSFEDAKKFVEERKYEIEFSPEGNLRVEFEIFGEILQFLGQRIWSVFIAPNEGPEFICSDHPVTLAWKDGRSAPVGYGLQQTEVFFPLGRRVGLYGVFESPLKPVIKLKPGAVATMNGRVARNSERHIYSALDSFFVWHEGQIREVRCAATSSLKNKLR